MARFRCVHMLKGIFLDASGWHFYSNGNEVLETARRFIQKVGVFSIGEVGQNDLHWIAFEVRHLFW